MRKIALLFIICAAAVCIFSISVYADEMAVPSVQKIPTRPNPQEGPTKVEMFIWIIDIDSINSAQQNFVANVFVRARWKDPRLAHGSKDLKRYSLIDIWSPRFEMANEIGIVRKTLPDTVDVEGDGTVIYRQRYVGPFSQPLKLTKFPFDSQVFGLHLACIGIEQKEIEFVPMAEHAAAGLKDSSGIAKNISLPDWSIVNYRAKPLAYELAPRIKSAGYVFEFTAKRHSGHYVFKVILPLILIVFMSWSVFWINPENLGTQISVATTSMLTLIAYRFTVDMLVPRVAYMTRLDEFILVSTILVFLSLIEVNITGQLVVRKQKALAEKIGYFSRIFFPAAFLIAAVYALTISG